MLGNHIQFECFDMRERLRLSQTGNRFQRRVRTRTDNHLVSTDSASCSIRLCDLQCSGTDEAAGPQDELHPALLKNVEMNIDRVGYHPALAVTHSRHIDPELGNRDAELSTPAHVRVDLRTMYDVFTGQAGDVVARASNIFALDEGDSLSLLSRRPSSDF